MIVKHLPPETPPLKKSIFRCYADSEMRTADFDFKLPPGLIAQSPAAKRDESRLLVLHRDSGKIARHSRPASGSQRALWRTIRNFIARRKFCERLVGHAASRQTRPCRNQDSFSRQARQSERNASHGSRHKR